MVQLVQQIFHVNLPWVGFELGSLDPQVHDLPMSQDFLNFLFIKNVSGMSCYVMSCHVMSLKLFGILKLHVIIFTDKKENNKTI